MDRNSLAVKAAMRNALPVGVIVCEAVGQQKNCENLYQQVPEYAQNPLNLQRDCI